MPRLPTLGPLVRQADTRTVATPPKRPKPVYNSPEFIAFRATVLARSNYQCEHIDQLGRRCTKARPEHRLYAHHRTELSDGGSLTDPDNGMTLCAEHHQYATMAARLRRYQS
jgi:hypothetical protein